MSATQAAVYATDEDIALRASVDLALLCPRDQVIAAGVDGAFLGTDRWALQSNEVNFGARGCLPGHVIQLLGPSSAFGASGALFAVGSVQSGGGLGLRRLGFPAGMGEPPAPAGGLNGVVFRMTTLGPQIELACADLDRRFGIDEALPGRRRSDLIDTRPLREAVALMVLHARYLDLAQGTDGPSAQKAHLVKAQLEELLARLTLRFADTSGSAATSFGTRMAR